MASWKQVGVIGVDAGLCYIGDPCYILHKTEPYQAIGKSWAEFCDLVGYETTQLNYDGGHPGLAVVSATGYGDGTYPVYAKINEKGRVMELKVVFIDKDAEPEDEHYVYE